jgi:hypothetical protein
MLHEIVGLTDEPPTKRRWFHDDFFDLFVWQTLQGEMVRFQLCYGIHSSEHALVWQSQGGLFHDGPGTQDPEALRAIIERFDHSAPTLPKVVRQVVWTQLQQFAQEALPPRRKAFRRAAWQKRLPAQQRKAG